MDKIVEACRPALRTRTELRKYTGKKAASAYNFTRLKACLLSVAFDINGEYQVHRNCLEHEFNLSNAFMTCLRKKAIEHSGRRWTAETKAYVKMHKLRARVLVPDECGHLSVLQYLETLADNNKVG